MNISRKNLVNIVAVVCGLLGLLVLVLPWYTLESSSSWGGSAFGGTYLGFAAAGTSFFGYALYILPILAIGMIAKNTAVPLTSKAKCLFLEFIGVVEFVCMMLLNMSMKNYDTDVSGYGMSVHAGFEPAIGLTIAGIVYIATFIIGFVVYFIAPNEELAAPITNAEAAPTDENTPTTDDQ